MNSLRPLLNGVLGLALLVQGVAFASAPLAFAAPELAAVEQAAAMDELPCHGDPQPAAPEAAPCPCCDGGCIDMSGCAFGQSAAAVPSIRFHVTPVQQAAIAAPERPTESVSPSSLLRPPISVHA